jgi:LemA protein
MALWIILAIVLVVVVLYLVLTYNSLVGGRNRTQEAWSQIDVELKRRHDLVPNLVNTVQGYASHERGTLEAVTSARANAVSAGATGDPQRIAQAENQLTGALRSLFAVSENYPDLKAVTSFTQLQEQLTATEDKIEFSRRYYNGSARDYNISLQRFPNVLVAGPFGFKAFGYFQADEGDRAVPQVSFPGTTGATGAPGTGDAQGQPTSAGPPPAGPPQSGPPLQQ